MATDPWAQFPDAGAAPAAGGDPFASFPDASKDMMTHPAGMQQAPSFVKPGERNIAGAFKSAFVRDPDTRLRVAAQSLFPNEPDAVKKYDFRMIGDRIAFKPPGGDDFQYAAGRGSEFVGGLLANTPEMIAGGIGSLAASPVIGGTLGVAGARGIKNAITGLVTDEPQTIGGNLADIGVNAGMELATGGLVKGGLTIANRGRRIDLTPRDIAGAAATRDRIKQGTGVDVDLGLASGDRRLLAFRNWLAQQPNATADAVQGADEAAAAQFVRAADDVLDKIARAKPQGELGMAGINSARGVIEQARRARDSAVAPYYEAAGKVSLSADVVSDISSDPLIARAAKQVLRDPVYQRQLAGVPPESVGYWHQVKRRLDSSYSVADRKGDRTAARQYADAARSLNEKLGAASPEYAQANEFFAKSTREILEPLESGPIGVISKIKDQRAATAAAKLFKDPNIGPKEILQARALISKQDPEAWNGLVRQFVANEFERARTVTQGAQETNVPGKLFQSIWGNEGRRARLNAALGKDATDALGVLMETAEVLARAPVRGSNTQPNQAIQEMLNGPAAWWARIILNPKSSAVQAATESAVERNAAQLWEALADPAKVRQLKIAVRIPDSTRRAAYISGVLASQSAAAAAQPLRPQQQSSTR
jgi:hypothetical protein